MSPIIPVMAFALPIFYIIATGHLTARQAKVMRVGFYALFLLACFATMAIAQDPAGITVTPIFETGTYNRTQTYDGGRANYSSIGLRSATVEKGIAVDFRGTDRWSTQVRFTTGGVGIPIDLAAFTDGTTSQSPYMNGFGNSTVTFDGDTRSLDVTEAYTRGLLTYRAGLTYRSLRHTDSVTIPTANPSYSESEFNDTYVGPTFGVSVHPTYGSITVTGSLDAAPRLRHAGSFEYRLPNLKTSTYSGTTSSSSLSVDLQAGFRIVKNVGITGGWRRTSIHTDDAGFYLASPAGKTPQTDSWSSFYFGVQLIH